MRNFEIRETPSTNLARCTYVGEASASIPVCLDLVVPVIRHDSTLVSVAGGTAAKQSVGESMTTTSSVYSAGWHPTKKPMLL